jgi:hypothetical protein
MTPNVQVGTILIEDRPLVTRILDLGSELQAPSSSQKENLSAKRCLALPSWHGWATNKQEEFEALDHHGCLACPGRVDLLSEIAMKLI